MAILSSEPVCHRAADGKSTSFPATGLVFTLNPVYKKFLADLNTSDCIRFESEELLQAVFERAHSLGLPPEPSTVSYQTLMLGYSLADNCFPYHPLEAKVYVAIYTWMVTQMDEAEHIGMLDEVELFQQRWIRGEDQPNDLLRSFAAHLRLTYELWDPCVANTIITATFNFLSASVLNARQSIKEKYKNPSPGGQKFPQYMRRQDGIGEAYAWFTFPKAKYPDFEAVIEAIEDMGLYICLVNDVLSFYKEELNGDTANYIHGVAAHRDGDVLAALDEAAKETVECAKRVESVLKGKGVIYEEAWRLHANGFIHLHLMRTRYRLCEVGVQGAARLEEKEVVKTGVAHLKKASGLAEAALA